MGGQHLKYQGDGWTSDNRDSETRGISLEILRPTQDQGFHTGITPDNASWVEAEEQGFL